VLNHDIPIYRIYVLGMGNAPRPATAEGEKPRRTTGGRVEVSLLKNDVEQLSAQANTPPATGASGTENQGGMTGTSTAAPSNETMHPATANPAAPATQPQQQPPQQ
jgi:hypothetical protein